VDKKIRTLASNPFILWLISVIVKGDPEKIKLLEKRGKLFQQFTTRMPRLRAREGIRPDVPLDVVVAMLTNLAFAMQEFGTLTAELKEIRNWKIPTADRKLEDVLVQAKEWRFLKSDGTMGEQVEFLHQLFLEFFVAMYLDAKLEDGQDYITVLDQRPFNDRWNEILEILGGISKRAAGLVVWLNELSLAQRDWRLAALGTRCLKAGVAVHDRDACLSVVNMLKIAPLGSNERDEMSELPEEVVETLKNMGNPLALEPLISVLENADSCTGMYAAKALGQIGNRRAVAPLIKVIEEAYEDVDRVIGAIEALTELGDLQAIEPLIKFSQAGDVMSGSDCVACEDASWALEKLLDRNAVERLFEILSCTKKNVNDSPLSNLLRPISDATSSSWFKDTMHLEALCSFCATEDPRLIGPLIAFQDEISGKNTGLDELVSRNLERIRDRQDAEPLLALLNPDPEVRRRAVTILGGTGNERIRQLLERLVREDRGQTLFGKVADAAQEAIQEIQKRNEMAGPSEIH
jgi:HEAT repeat protein